MPKEAPSESFEFNLNLDDIQLIDEEDEVSDFETIARKFEQTRSSLEEEIKVFRTQHKLKNADREIKPLETQEQVEDFKREALIKLNQASRAAQQLEDPSHDKVVQESQELMDNLVRARDQFYADMKIVQIHQMKFVIDAAEVLKIEQDPAKVIEHTSQIRRNLDKVAAMPDLDRLSEISSGIAQMVYIHPQISAFASDSSNSQDLVLMQREVSRTIAVSVSQASRGSMQAFNDFISKASEVEKISTVVDPTVFKEFEHEAAFTNSVSKYFEEALIIASAIKDGRVQKGQSNVDFALNTLQSITRVIAPAAIRQGVNGFLQAAQFVISAKEDAANRNVASFGTIAEGVEANDEERKLRQNIIQDISKKLYRSYSQKDENGVSPLDNFTQKGQEKISRLVVEEFIAQMGSFKFPDFSELPPFDRKEFRENANYRSEMSQKFGIEIDENKIGGERYLNESISKVENKIYVDFISDRLIGQVIQGRDSQIPKQFVGIGSNVTFAKEDLVPQKQNRTFTFEGLTKRAGIITANGDKYLPSDRAKDGKEAKYGFRLATADEEKAIAQKKEIAGYKISSVAQAKAVESQLEAVAPVVSKTAELKKEEKPPELPDPTLVIKKIQEVAKAQVEKHLDNFGIEQRAKINQINQNLALLKEKLAKAQAELTEKSKPKPAWKKFLTRATAGLYSGGKPNDVTAEFERVQDLNGRINQNNEELKILEERTKNIQEIKRDYQKAIEAKVENRGVNLVSAIDSLGKIINLVETSQEVIEAVQSHKEVSWGEASRKVNFNHIITESFRQGFVIAEALKNGKVRFADDRVDIAIGAAQNAVGFIPPVAQQGVALALQVAVVVNGIRKDQNAKTLANFGTQKGEAEEEIRPQIIHAIGEKLHNYFSVKSAGKSVMDNLTESGTNKFADALTARIMDQMMSITPIDQNKVEKFDLTKFESDEKYRGEINKKFGNVIDVRDIDSKMTAKINDTLYADAIANQLVRAVLQTKKAGLSLDNFHFEKEDLAPNAQNKDLTIEGMIYRVGVITSSGNRYIPESRAEDVKTSNSKYGFRAATPEEEAEAQKNNGVLKNYAKFNPAKDAFETQKEAVEKLLKPENFKAEEAGAQEVGEALQKLIENYKEQKSQNPDLLHIDFLKNSTLDSGESKRFLGVVVGKSEARSEFNDLKKPLLALLSAADRVSMDEIKGKQPEVLMSSFVGSAKLSSAQNQSSDIFGSIKSATQRDPKLLESLKPFGETKQEMAHITARVNAAESTNALSAVTSSMLSSIKEMSEKFNVLSKKVEQVQLKEEPLQPSLVKFMQDQDKLCKTLNDSHLKEDVLAKNKSAIDQGKGRGVIQNEVTDFVENYHAKVLSGASSTDLQKFAADNSPIKTDANTIIAKSLIDLAVNYSEAMIEKAQDKKAANDLLAKPATNQNSQDKKDLIQNLQAIVDQKAERAHVLGMAIFKHSVAKKGGSKVDAVDDEGRPICRITMPEVKVEGEAKPMYLVVIEDLSTHTVKDVELHGGNAKNMKAFDGDDTIELADKGGKVKESYKEAVKELVKNYKDIQSETKNPKLLKNNKAPKKGIFNKATSFAKKISGASKIEEIGNSALPNANAKASKGGGR